jgi:SAM-dependent methyltransferase
MSNGLASAALSENAIRPDAMIEESYRLHALDLKWLLARQAEFVDVSCPACESNHRQPLWQKDGFSYVCCADCRTGYLNPRPTPEILDEYYRVAEIYNYWQKYVFPASEATRREQIAQPRAKRILELCERRGISRGILLEVGAGYGTFCEEAIQTGKFKKVMAIEPTPAMAQACRERGVEVIELPIEQVSLDESLADVAVSFEVIEHLFSPKDFLAACAHVLKEDGLLVLTCPNINGFDVVTLGSVSNTVDPAHLNYFNPVSLTWLFERCSFEVVELLTPGRLDAEIVRKRTMAGMYDLSTQPFLRQILVDEWERVGQAFQKFLADNLLSSHMWIVGRRR